MKITKFEHFHVDCGWEIYSFLKISTDEGLTGWSEFREHRRPGIAAAIHGMGEFWWVRTRARSAASRPRSIRSPAASGGLNQNAAGAILNMPRHQGKALGVPVTSCSAAWCAAHPSLPVTLRVIGALCRVF
jgi:hypothetical protein